MSVRGALVVLSLALVGFAPAPLPRKQSHRGPAGIAGTWEFARWEVGGMRHELQEKTFHLLLTANSFTFVERNGGGGSSTLIMRLDPSASPPSFTLRRAEDAWVAYVGSYRLQGSELTMIFDGGDDLAKRPTDFDTGRPTCKYVLRRVR